MIDACPWARGSYPPTSLLHSSNPHRAIGLFTVLLFNACCYSIWKKMFVYEDGL